MAQMISEIYVDNFRSLKNFHLVLKPGINVLVGPNGSGKTNIIKWFEFLSLLGTSSIREAIGKIGGANHVFRRSPSGSYESNLSFSFKGFTEVRERFYRSRSAEEYQFWVFYEFDGEISIVDNQIFFSKQDVSLWMRAENTSPLAHESPRPNTKPHLSIKWRYDLISDEITSDVKINKPRQDFFRKSGMGPFLFDDSDLLNNFLAGKHTLENLIVSSRFFPVAPISYIRPDLYYGVAYNISPSSVRSTLDISSPPGVQYDGGGVASTLYDLYVSMQDKGGGRYRVGRSLAKDAGENYNRIVDYFKLSNQYISGISIDLDNFRNEFILNVIFDYNGERHDVPLALLSDGTVKWLAIVTAITTQKTAFYVEEPENFLHPRLQENIVSILRSEVMSNNNTRFAIVTTHSETLLNTLQPEEIILVRMDNGTTRAERLENPEEISAVISKSGFGLGYFYISGGF